MPKKSFKKPTISFREKVYRAVKKIPRGKTLTYKENVLNRNPDLKNIPCHRVIKSDRTIGGFNKGNKRKVALLRKEGVIIKNRRVVL